MRMDSLFMRRRSSALAFAAFSCSEMSARPAETSVPLRAAMRMQTASI